MELVLRTLIIYTVLLAVMRIMGKREVGQLTPSDLVVAIVIAELAALPMENRDLSIMEGIIPILTLMVAEILLSWASLKSISIRKIISGTPSIVIDRGIIVERELRRQRYNIHDMLSQLRDKGINNIADVEYAILEPSGRLSVFPKANRRAVVPDDIGVNPPKEALPVPLIVDGQIITINLQKISRDSQWLSSVLQERGFRDHRQILFASIDNQGKIYICAKEKS